jgi:CubicO group peptidase (beta-lactamase class C family)
MAQASPTAVQGTCDPRFDLVREEFERNFAERGETGASVSITIDGSPVVDLWGGVADPATGRPWERDTTVVVWSCSKGAAAICAHVLVSRGELDLDAPVARFWPEFAQNGKEEAFGHSGIGGSIGFADPKARLSFGYAMNRHGSGAGLNERGQRLVDAAYRSVGATTDAYGTWA